MRILLTRLAENNSYLRNRLEKKGFEVIEESLIAHVINEELIARLAQKLQGRAVVITSNFAAKIVSSKLAECKLSAYVVGEVSRDILEAAGVKILGWAENMDSLLLHGDLIYLRGSEISKKLPFAAEEYIIYDSVYKDSFLPEIIDLFKRNQIDGVALFSQKTAQAFLKCASNAGIVIPQHMKLYCLSDKVASVFDGASHEVRVAMRPNVRSMLGVILE